MTIDPTVYAIPAFIVLMGLEGVLAARRPYRGYEARDTRASLTMGIGNVLTAIAFNTLYQFWVHTELVGRIGPFERVFNTASHHRVHHGANPEYLDRNHAGILITWDKLFGTFEPERAPVRYGLTYNLDSFAPLHIAFHEWAALWRDVRRAPTWRARLGHIFGPPGWSPDGSTLTAAQLRARAARRSVDQTPAPAVCGAQAI